MNSALDKSILPINFDPLTRFQPSIKALRLVSYTENISVVPHYNWSLVDIQLYYY